MTIDGAILRHSCRFSLGPPERPFDGVGDANVSSDADRLLFASLFCCEVRAPKSHLAILQIFILDCRQGIARNVNVGDHFPIVIAEKNIVVR